MTTINFYSHKADYGCFSNFYPAEIRIGGKTWRTTEHYFQAQKFAGTKYESHIRNQKSPNDAAREGRRRDLPLRKDWESVKDNIMQEALVAKFQQHPDLKKALLETGDAVLVEHTENDLYWGDGGNGKGKNMLGKLLMKIRDEQK